MHDFRFALRTLARSPGLTAVAVASLALGIGANTAIFSVTNAVILRSLPVEKPNELVLLRYVSKKGNIFDSFSYKDYLALREVPNVLTGLSAVTDVAINLASNEATERVPGELVSGNYFPLLGVHPRIGRLIGPDDDRDAGGHPVCVISTGLWQSRYGSATDIVGRQVQLNGRAYSILGVTPESFDGISQGSRAQIYVPLMMAAQITNRAGDSKVQPPFLDWDEWLNVVGRRQPGVTLARAEAVLDARFDQLPLAHRDATFEMSSRHGTSGDRARLMVIDGRQGFDNLRFRYERPVLFLLFLVGLLLLIACANVASLLAARAAGQRKQIAIRLALGASRWSLIRQQLAESSVLAAAGAGAGFLLSIWMSDLLVQLTPAGSTGQFSVRPDLTVLGFLLAITCLTTLLFGIAPALESGRAGVGPVLKSESTGGGKRRGMLSGALVSIQVALSVTLLAGAGLLLHSLHNLHSVAMGFQPENVVVASVNPGANGYSTDRARTLFDNLLDRAESIPGVRAASASLISPVSGSLWLYSVDVPGYPKKPIPMAYTNAVGPGYFAAIGSELIRGREFTRSDRKGAPPVVVVNEQMAKKFWPGRDPVGQRFKASALGNNEVEVVGLVRDSIYRDLREDRQPILYVPLLEGNFRSATFELRITGNPTPVFTELRARARAVDRDIPLFDLRTLEAQIAGRLSPERMLATVSTILGALAIILAMVGLYSILANSVAQRSREIGIRMALGAEQRQVIGMILRDTLRMVAIGVVLGIPMSLAASRWIQSFLFGVKTQDPVTYVAILSLIAVAGLLAAYVPSRRASNVDPMVVLRYD
ncbi:MAG TPA: ABC transporter permease [Bryobacteraceae bacterium]|nr:ABC transporter permease [Bryobacteraceae bacterium]